MIKKRSYDADISVAPVSPREQALKLSLHNGRTGSTDTSGSDSECPK